jgi:hypothetical protein
MIQFYQSYAVCFLVLVLCLVACFRSSSRLRHDDLVHTE